MTVLAMEVKSKKQALADGDIHFFTGKPCKHGHFSKRFSSTGGCCECLKIGKKNRKRTPRTEAEIQYQRDYYKKNKEKIMEQHRAYNEKNREGIAAYKRKWQEKNKDRVRANFNRWVSENRERYAANSRSYAEKNRHKTDGHKRAWKKRNKHLVTESTQRRNAQKLNATPAWANKKAMAREYKKASLLTKETGVKYQVDHIVPLRSKLVCGLHCEANLQVVKAKENLMKSNKTWPNMPEKTA